MHQHVEVLSIRGPADSISTGHAESATLIESQHFKAVLRQFFIALYLEETRVYAVGEVEKSSYESCGWQCAYFKGMISCMFKGITSKLKRSRGKDNWKEKVCRGNNQSLRSSCPYPGSGREFPIA